MNYIKEVFSKIASKIFDQASQEASELGIPGFSQTEFVDLKPNVDTFASNLIYTFGDFCNSFHKDKDYNSYTYGIWAPLVLKTGELVTKADNDNLKIDGAQFIILTYKVQVDYSKHVGIVKMI